MPDLSLLLMMHRNAVVNFKLSLWTSMSIAYAIYYLVLRMKACCSSSMKRYLQPIPVCGQKPPIPNSDEYKKVVMVGFLKITLLTAIPYFDDSRNSNQRSRLSRVRLESLILVLCLAIDSIQCRLLIKCLASRIMKQTWLTLPTRVDRSW